MEATNMTVKEMRLKLDMTQEMFSQRYNIPKRTIENWESGKRTRLDGKRGFVTGCARGIGKCTATAFAEAGADVAIVDIDIETAKRTADEIAGATKYTIVPAADVLNLSFLSLFSILWSLRTFQKSDIDR